MSTFLMLIAVAVLGTALFDFIYYLPNFKALEAAEEQLK